MTISGFWGSVGQRNDRCQLVNSFVPLMAVVIVFIFFSIPANAQFRAGGAFLKLIPGARQQALAGSLTGSLDNVSAIYANPGAVGFLREWGWNVAYTSWVPGIYHTSAFFGKNIATPWSRQTRFALSASYLGVKEFDSSGGRAPAVSGGDFWVAASIGQPFRKALSGFALGANVKYLRSRLDNFDAGAFVLDLGGMYRTKQIRLMQGGLLEHGVFSLGAGVTHIGSSLNFMNFNTPLPFTYRFGAAFHAGTHDGLQATVSIDYRSTRDEEDFTSLGFEFSWASLLTFRFGYNLEDLNLFNRAGAGMSIGLTDLRLSPKNLIPGRNKAVRFDFAALNNSDFFGEPYHGAINHYAIRPERFDFASPPNDALINSENIVLNWSHSRDPDLLDDVTYWLLVDPSRDRISEALEKFENGAPFWNLLADESFFRNDTLKQTEMRLDLDATVCEEYFWTVVAVDKDRHFRVIGGEKKRIANFRVALPDLQVTDIRVLPDTTLQGPRQGAEIMLFITNVGESAAENFSVEFADSSDSSPTLTEFETLSGLTLLPGALDSVAVSWRAEGFAQHYVTAMLDPANTVPECNDSDNRLIFDLPKPPPMGHDLAIVKTANRDTVFAEETYAYTLTVWNNGPITAKNFTVEDVLPDHLTLKNASRPTESEIAEERKMIWRFDSLAVGDSLTIQYEVETEPLLFSPGAPLDLEGVTFEFNKDILTASAKIKLQEFGRAMKQVLELNPGLSFEIGGHTDDIGTHAYNDRLSDARAKSVQAYLASLDPIHERLTARGYGERQPIAPNHTPECREKNRRVEIKIPADTRIPQRTFVNKSFVSTGNDPDTTNNFAEATVQFKHVKTPPPGVIVVNFGFDSSNLGDEAKQALDNVLPAIVTELRKDAELYVEISGHTDSRGSDQYNQPLSERRAKSVLEYFYANCIRRERMKALGYGESRPIADNVTEEGMLKNRRVEFRFRK